MIKEDLVEGFFKNLNIWTLINDYVRLDLPITITWAASKKMYKFLSIKYSMTE